jgi:hypothetical protein
MSRLAIATWIYCDAQVASASKAAGFLEHGGPFFA